MAFQNVVSRFSCVTRATSIDYGGHRQAKLARHAATMAIACCVFLTVGSAVAAADGIHARTTTKLLDAFKELGESRLASPETAIVGQSTTDSSSDSKSMFATFGTGCFWCTEAVFEPLDGVIRVDSGYSGGYVPNPTYEQVCSKLTGHAEVVHLEYDPDVITFAKLLEVFWFSHDPTTLNRQGVDKGPQYRSAIFYHTKQQQELAEIYKRKLDEVKAFRDPIVTEITKFSVFYRAENYHQDYFALNGRLPYCRRNIQPKIRKLRKLFEDDLKPTR